MSRLSVEKQQILVLIKSDNDYEKYFFASAVSVDWLVPLKEEHYFMPEKIIFDENGNALFWSVLDYLEKVSLKTITHPECGNELIDIIGSVIKYSREQKKINNYYIWWYCVKILNNIPNEIVKKVLSLETFNAWLNEWTNRSSIQNQIIDDIGRKLLPKFLNDDNTLPFAESIIDAITGIEAGKRELAFLSKDDAQLTWDSYRLLKTFKENLAQIAAKCSDSTIFHLADKLKLALEYEHYDTWINISEGINLYQLKVSRVPLEGLKPKEIGYQQSMFDCSALQYSPEEKEKVEKKLDIWNTYNIKPEKVIGQEFIFKAENREEFIAKIKEKLPLGIEWGKVPDLDLKIAELFDNLYSDYSYIWYKLLDQDIVNARRDAPEVLTNILKNVVLARCDLKKGSDWKILESFLSDIYKFPIFKRIVLFCVNSKWEEYNALFKSFICSCPDALSNPVWEVEMQDVLRTHSKKFDRELLEKIKELIENVPRYYLEQGEKYVAYWKYKWLSPLREVNDEFASSYNKAKQQAEIKEDKPYEVQRSTVVSWGGHKSPLTMQEILSMPIDELVEFLVKFNGPAGRWGGMHEGKPDKEGLAEMLRSAAKENAKKFTDSLDLFIKQGLYLYVNAILRGFWEALRSEQSLPWDKILGFSKEYLGQAWFIDEAFEAQGEDRGDFRGKYVWVIDAIVDLIKESNRNDRLIIEPDQFVLVDEIFEISLKYVQGELTPKIDHDAITYAMNTTLGRVIESYIDFSLRVARVTGNRGANWGTNKYEPLLKKGIEAYTWLGRYLPNIKYLDEKYVKGDKASEGKITELSKLAPDDTKWRQFMEGYLFGAYVYDDIYGLMRQHYIKAIENNVFEEKIDERLVQHIALGYLRGFESLNKINDDGVDSLFYKLLDDTSVPEKKKRWLAVVDFFWRISGNVGKNDQNKKEEITADTRSKILEFWSWTVKEEGAIKLKLDAIYSDFLGSIAELTLFLDKIDDTSEKWLMLSAPYIEKRHNVTFFIDYLASYEDDESLKRIGKIYLEVLKGATPTFRQEDIQLIVERLYKLKDKYPELKGHADEICNTYGRRGIHFLQKIYEDNQ
jgi:hypothetical protein